MAKNEESAMMRQYNDMKKQKPDSLLLFRCGDFYETYQEDAKECAKILGITLTKKNDVSMAGFPHHALDQYLPKLIRAGKRVAICDLLPDPPKKPVKRGITELTTNNSELTTKNSETMKPNENESGRSATQGDACQSKNVQNAQVNNIKTSADVTEAQDIMPVVTPSAKAKPAENTGRTKIVVARVPRPGESADKPKVKPETKPTGVLPVLTLAVYTTKRGEQAPRIDGFSGEDDPRWKKHYDEKIRQSNKREKAKRKNNKLYQEMKDKSAEEKEALLKKIIHVPSDPFGANYFIDHITGEKKYYFIMGAKYMDVAQQLVDAYNSGDEQAIAQAEQAVIDCKSGIVAEIEASRNADGDKVETLPETKVYTAAEVADLIQRIANSDPKALAEYDALTKKAA